MSKEAVLTCSAMNVNIGEKNILQDILLQVPSGCLCAIIGPNGAGKSSLIRSALGMLPIQSGELRVLGQPPGKEKARIGYVPQKESVDWDFPVSVFDVVMMGTYNKLGLFRRPGAEQRAIVESCLRQMGIEDIAKRQIRELSGGQQQRVFLARALAQQAEVYFMDEPFVGVDAATEQKIISILKELRERGTSMFVVHHDLQTVPEYFDYAILLNRSVVAAGPVNEVFSDENLHRLYGGRLHILGRLDTAERV